MTDSISKPRFSIVVPLYCEQGNIELLINRLVAVLESMDTSYEVILVDDGSTDATWSSIVGSNIANPRIRGFRLSRNFGHQHALLAGLHQARGAAIISMDGDLQHPPEIIPQLVARWEAGFDIVGTNRIDLKVAGYFKRTTSRWFYRFFSMLSEVELSEGSSDFRLMGRNALDALLEMRDARLFLRGAVQWLGFKTTVVPYQLAKRQTGETKFSLAKMLRFAFGAILAYSTKPLRLGIWLGLLTALLSIAELGYIIVNYFSGVTVEGWASTVGILSLLFGVLFVMLGIIGTYIANIHTMLQSRPNFIISERTSLMLDTENANQLQKDGINENIS